MAGNWGVNSQVFTVCLIVSGLASAAIVLYYAKKNPNPYFRPKKGELVMMSIFLGIISGTASLVLSSFFEADINIKELAEKADRKSKEATPASSGAGDSAGGTDPNEEENPTSGSSIANPYSSRPPIPPFIENR